VTQARRYAIFVLGHLKGGSRGEQRTEAVKPGSQETQTEEEGVPKTGPHEGPTTQHLNVGPSGSIVGYVSHDGGLLACRLECGLDHVLYPLCPHKPQGVACTFGDVLVILAVAGRQDHG